MRSGCVWAALVLRDVVRRDAERGLDVAGTVCCIVGLTTLTFALSKGGLTGWDDSVVIGGLVIAAIFLPAWVVIETRSRAPMLDLTIFKNRLFAAAAAAAFINGLARFALTFLFVFYFQGPQRQDPITAGLELAPMAAGMVVASPIAGRIADRRGSRMLAALGMLISAVALVGMTTLGVSTPYWQSAIWLALVGIGSGVFMSPNTAAMMAAVPAKRRGVASGARTMLQNMGAVLSIAVRDGRDHVGRAQERPVLDLLGRHERARCQAARAVHRQHAHRALDACRGLADRRGRVADAARTRAGSGVVTVKAKALKIGELAARTGTTPRTIRYYEELGLLPARPATAKGTHRVYDEGDVETLDSLVRLRELLGLSLEGLRSFASAESARAGLRREFGESETPEERIRILNEARGHVDIQLGLLRERRETIAELEAELEARRALIESRLAELR